MNIDDLTTEQLEQELQARKGDKNKAALAKREAYESLKGDLLQHLRLKTLYTCEQVKDLFDLVLAETTAFKEIMREYGQLKKAEQMGFHIEDDNFRIDVVSYKVKKFDERADLAAERLIEFLQNYIAAKSTSVSIDAMYQLAMTLLERNKMGDLDYKSISKLYALEEKFNSEEYSAIMQLFKESNFIKGNATNFYFSQKNEQGVWIRLQPSFNRL